MASDNLLNLVNKVIVQTGDYAKLSTVIGSPANIAERIMHFLNQTLDDIARSADFHELRFDFTGIADGTNVIYDASGADVRPDSAVTVSVDTDILTEIDQATLHKYKTENTLSGLPQVFSRLATSAGLLSVEIYPKPASGATITIVSYQRPTHFTLTDTATTEIMNDSLLVLGALAQMDAYDGLGRGYQQLYQLAKQDAWQQRYKNEQFRIQTEDYH